MLKNIKRLIHPQEFKEKIVKASILLDTNILISFIVRNPAYLELLEIMTANYCSYFTLDLCLFEFFKGSDTAKDITARQELLKRLDISTISSVDLKEEFMDVLSIYRKSGSTLDLADLFLAAILRKYQDNQNMYLLTGNYTDFMTNYFDRKFILIAEDEKQIKPLVFLQLDTDAFKKGSKSFYT